MALSVLNYSFSHIIFQVSILVVDVNDESPEFQFAVYKGQIEENLPPGSSVLNVKAVDNDKQDMVRLSMENISSSKGTSFYSL